VNAQQPQEPLQALVVALAANHTDAHTRTPQRPLLVRLRANIRPSLGKTHSGHSGAGERNVINLAAFELYEDLDGRIASLYVMATDLPSLGRPEANLIGWHRAFRGAWLRREITEAQELLALTRLGSWVRRIEDLFEPPVVKELLAPCPVCGMRWKLDRDGTRHSTLYAQYRPGSVVEAGCRACNTRWLGDAMLVSLAKAIEAEVDVDALREARSLR